MYKIPHVDYHITDVCNLNCVSCCHFCPLVPKDTKHKSLEQIKADLYLLSKFKDNLEELTIMGGEPTLHPQFKEILMFARELFPYNQISITTNGLKQTLLVNMKNIFDEYDILINISGYPFKEDYVEHYENLKNALGDRCIKLFYNEQFTEKPFANRVINSGEETLKCRMRWCTHLLNGRLYLCNYAAQLPYFKNYFGDNAAISSNNDDYVDLNTCTLDDIQNMIDSSQPQICLFCKECNRWYDANMDWVNWKVSDRNIEEWIDYNY